MNVLHEIERIKLQRRNFSTKRAIFVAGYMLGRYLRSKKQEDKSFHTDGQKRRHFERWQAFKKDVSILG